MLTTEMLLPLLVPFLYIFLLVVLLIVLKLLTLNFKFRHSQYGTVSGNSFFKTIMDKGNFGEFLTFRILERLKGDNKVLTNLYISKQDGSTTELDLVLVNQTGVYVFESKNYSGWIFGDDKSKNWTQSLKGGKKTKFLNPVWQNKGHIGALSQLLSEVSTQHFYSYIVFSERCELKKVISTSQSVSILRRNQLSGILKRDFDARNAVLTVEQVDAIHDLLKKHSRADDDVKAQHIQHIKNKFDHD